MQRGLTRFAVLTDNTDDVYQQLKAAGETLLTEPTTVMTPQDGWRICLAQDPDGVVVQVTHGTYLECFHPDRDRLSGG